MSSTMTPSASSFLTFDRDFQGRLRLRCESGQALSLDQQKMLQLAANAYGYLLGRNEQICGQEMARRIEASEAPGPQRDAVLKVIHLWDPEPDCQDEPMPGESPAAT